MTSLIAPIIWTIVVTVVLWPRVLGRRLGFSSYLLTMTINELPMVFLAIVSIGIVASFEDRPAGVAGVTWLLLWGYVTIGFIWAQLRAGRAAPALERGLSISLGPLWRRSIRPDLASLLREGSPWLAGILRPFQRHRAGVERIRDVPYGPDAAHRLDIYRGAGPPDPRPILIHFHEGGFVQGGKSRETVTLMNQLAAHGWLCLSANYRLRDAAAWPNPLVDAKRAIVWARQHATDYDADPHDVHLIGGSAGGHMAVNAALTASNPLFQPGFEDADTAVSSAVSLYGYLGRRSRDRASEPAALAAPSAPPLFVIQGTNDTGLGVPLDTARQWAASLRQESGAPVVYAELPGAQHAFDLFASVRARATANAVESFLAWARSQNIPTS